MFPPSKKPQSKKRKRKGLWKNEKERKKKIVVGATMGKLEHVALFF